MAKGISKELITEEAGKLIREKGISGFSMHALADRLHIKTASLYSHVSGIDGVMTLLGSRILEEYRDMQEKATAGRERTDALMSLALSCRSYAETNPEYYELIMQMQLSGNETLAEKAAVVAEPVMDVLDGFRLTEKEKISCERAFRAMVHGFISQEMHGYFSHFAEAPDESFRFAAGMVIRGIEEMEHEE